MRVLARALSLVLVPLLAALAAQESRGPVALAGDGPAAELAFEVREKGGGPIPARLTFVPPDGGTPELFKNVDAAPHELAARLNLVYTRSGVGVITVPPGKYTLYASRGLEWSLARRELELVAGQRGAARLELVHELETPGWVSGDFHLHTLTYSGHGDANLDERVLSFLGEGLEFAVATDHNHNTDYGPTVEALGAQALVRTVTGDEVTTPIGHFNAFPLDPARAPIDATSHDANALFRLIRAEPNAFGVVPVIQLNHPRLEGMDWFTRTGLDPTSALATGANYSRDFDAIEVLNENLALGYHDPLGEHVDGHGHLHSALEDWFHLLDLGERYAAVGNSDSHHVQAIAAGWPRNFVRAESDDPAHIDPAAVAAALRAKQVFTTTGPFVEFSVNGVSMGGEARAVDGHATLALRVRAASWIDCDRVKVVVNGDVVVTLPVPDVRTTLRLEQELELCFLGRCARHAHAKSVGAGPADAWVTLLVEGDDSLAPILRREARPLAIANPVWVDADGDGKWQSPRERIAAELAHEPTPDEARLWFEALAPAEQVLALALVPRGAFAAVLISLGLESRERAVRLSAARAAERATVGGGTPVFQRAWTENKDDPFLGALLVRAMVATRREQGTASLLGYVQRFGEGELRHYADEILPVLPSELVARWQVLGPLAPDAPELSRASGRPLGPAARIARAAGAELAWREIQGDVESGYVDLARALSAAGEPGENVVVCAQAYLRVPSARSVLCCFGSDDGSRVFLGDRLLYENRESHGANPLEKLLTLELQPGWNRLVLEIRNGSGDFGFYCRLLDTGVELAARAE